MKISKKYYAVRKGRNVGIFQSWEECKTSVNGYSGAKYKSFNNYHEASNYLKNEQNSVNNIPVIDLEEKIDQLISNNTLVAFTDGSFDLNFGAGYGAIIIYNKNNKRSYVELSAKIEVDNYNSSRNIAPEVFAVIKTIEWAIARKYQKIEFFVDYEGLIKWANGEWEARSKIAKLYIEKLLEYQKLVACNFEKVRAHTGIKYNEMADKLAKKAISLE